MKLSDIKSVFEDRLEVETFLKSIENEVTKFIEGHRKKGSSIPVHVIEDLEQITIAHLEVFKLCQLYIQKKLNSSELSYIVDSLLLSEKAYIEDENIESYLEEMTDFSINHPFTISRAKEIIAKIESKV